MVHPSSDAIVLSNGDPVPRSSVEGLPSPAFVVAADAGLHLAAPLGLDVDLVVGDLDSVDPALLASAETAGVAVDRHPLDKDRTDLALAMDAAVASGARRITVVGGAGGRVDHLLANGFLLAADAYAACEVRAWSTDARTDVVRPGQPARIDAPVGALCSLLPVHGPARGVTTAGLRYPLAGEDLHPGSSRGVSNVVTSAPATVSLAAGVLLAVRPLTDAPRPRRVAQAG